MPSSNSSCSLVFRVSFSVVVLVDVVLVDVVLVDVVLVDVVLVDVVLVDVVLVDVVLVDVVLVDVVIFFSFSLWRTQLFLILSPLVRHQGTAGRIL